MENDPDSLANPIDDYAPMKARTVRFTCGAPRTPRLPGDGSRLFFLRADAPADAQTSLWMADADGETKLADPRALLTDADAQDVPAEERARRERARESGAGIVDYTVDAAGRTVAFTLNGMLMAVDVPHDGHEPQVRRITLAFAQGEERYATPILNPRISPDGTRVAYSTGSAVVVADLASGQATPIVTVPAAERDTVRVGLAEFAAAEELDRYDGFWWGPDSRTLLVERFDASEEPVWTISAPADPQEPGTQHRYPRALTHNAIVTLLAVRLGDDRLHARHTARVDWDAHAYEYLASVHWSDGHDPLLHVLDRRQTDAQVLAVGLDGLDGAGTIPEAATDSIAAAATVPARQVSAAHDDRWIDVIGGVPAWTPDGRLVTFLNDLATDTNRLCVDGTPFTPVGWQVRDVLDVSTQDVLCVVQRSPELAPDVPAAWQDTAGGHDARSYDVVRIGYDGTIDPVTRTPGVWRAVRGGDGIVVWGRTMDDPRARMDYRFAGHSRTIANHAAVPGLEMDVRFVRLGERRLHAAIVLPRGARYAGARRLPVLMHPYGGPGFQEVTMSQSAYWDAQWWAEQGYIVVVADGRGTTGRGPRWDREMFLEMKSVSLADQVDAVRALPDALAALGGPEPDLERVAMIGWSYGGFLSAAAVLEAPDTFAAACAGAPPTDWTLYDTCYTERYLGLDPAVYERNGIIADAPGLRRPLMLIHGFADDNVTVAHSLRLSGALMAAGRPHTFLPLSGITHMTNDPTVARSLLVLQRDFLEEAMGR